MYGIRAVAAAHWRARWRGVLALGLLLGLLGGVVLAAGALALRTATAYPRLAEAVALDDARVLVPADQPGLVAAVPGMAGVSSAWVTSAFIAQVDGPALRFVSLGAGLDPPPDLLTPVIVDGRAPGADAVDEVVIGEPLAEMGGFAVGDELTLRLLRLAEVAQFAVGFGEPDGSVVPVRVVGVARMPSWGGALSNVLAGPGFARAYGAEAVAGATFVRLRDEPGAAQAFTDAYAAAAAAAPASAVAMYLPPTVELPTTDVDPAVRTAERVLTGGLAVFAVVLAGGGLLVVGQGVARHHGGGRAAQRVESALGLTAGQRTVARVLAALPGALLAGTVGAALTVGAGALEPLGSQSRFEPDPGFRPPWGLAVGGAVLLVVVFVALHAAAAAWAGRPRTAAPPPPSATRPPLWGAPAFVVGAGLALRGRRGLSATATVLGASVAVAGVVAAATFGAGLARLVDTPSRWGELADLTVVDAREPDISTIAADPRVAALDVVSSAEITLAGGEPLEITARETRTGAQPVETAAGRPPQRPGEIALGTLAAARLGAHVGDTVAALTPDGAPVPLTVTGLVVLRSESYGSLGEVGQVTPDQLAALAVTESLVSADVVAVPGAAPELFAELSQRLEVFGREVPDAITNLSDLVRLPELLALVLALVGGAGVAHAVHTAARRHRPDLAVLAVLGATPGQVRATVAAMAATLAVPAVLLGIPLGVLVARVLWAEVARSTGVAGDVALPVPLLVAVGPVVLAGALLAAALPGARAARTSPAAALRNS